MGSYYLEASVRLIAHIRSGAGAFTDPTGSIVIRIMDPNSTRKVTDGAMTKFAEGKYYYDYDTTGEATGTWTWEAVASGSGGDKTIDAGQFTVLARTA